MSRFDKLLDDILMLNKNLRFEDLVKALKRIGYVQSPSKSGGSHHTFKKEKCIPITIPKSKYMDIVYIRMVREAVSNYLNIGGDEK